MAPGLGRFTPRSLPAAVPQGSAGFAGGAGEQRAVRAQAGGEERSGRS